MSPLALRLWFILDGHRDFMPLKDLAALLGISERKLRADGDQPSILELASREIFEHHGAVIITRTGQPSGVKLSKDPAEIESAVRQMAGHLNSERRRVDFWSDCLYKITRGQLTLSL